MSTRQMKRNSINKNETDGTIWVQCENPICMKWRKVPKTYCEDFSKIQWFCSMNLDQNFNKCDVEQEKMYVPRGETIIFSELNVGSLVWAKMTGYPRWPGIISSDPCDDDSTNYISRYEDGTNDPKYYHIEFLGKPHSHAWVPAHSVELYNVSTADLCFTEKSMKKKAIRVNFENSLKEAVQLHKLTTEERLSYCIYTYMKCKQKEKDLYPWRGYAKTSKKVSPKQNQSPDMKNNGMFVNINGIIYPVIISTDKSPFAHSNMKINTENHLNCMKTEKELCDVAMPIVRRSQPKIEEKNGDLKKKRLTECTNIKSKKLKPGQGNRFAEIFKEKTKNSNVNGWSSTEDVMGETAANEEDVFWRAYQSYCEMKNIRNSTKHITWYNKTVDLFSLYKNVQSVGGYKQAVSHWKIWKGICCNILGVNTDSQFISLRKAYRQVLLQFELDQKKRMEPCFRNLSITSSNNFESQQQLLNSIPGAYPITTKQFNSLSQQQLSPVYETKGTPKSIHDTFEEVPQLITVAPDAQPEAVLKGALPMIPVKNSNDVFTLPSSNPQSPHHMYVTHDDIMISEEGLDVALEELDDLEQELQCMTQYSQSSLNIIQTDSEDSNNASYQPVSDSPNIKELNDVLGELTDVEDTLLELTGDILHSDIFIDGL